MHFIVTLWIFILIPVISIKAFPSRNPDEGSPNLIPCKEDWFLFGDKCYKVGGRNVGLTWEQASLYCEQEQGTLVTIDSQELQDFLVVFLLYDVKTNVWIGLNKLGRWADGSDLIYVNFDKNVDLSSQTKNGENCGEMMFYHTNLQGEWNLVNCNTKQPYICQSNKRERRKNPDPRFCSEEEGGGWRHSKSCYHVITKPKTWEDAENDCQAIDGHLVTILDDTTKYFLNYILSDVGDVFWIGIKEDYNIEYTHQKWTSGWRVNYNFLEPKFAADGDCFARTDESSATRYLCNNMLPYICERTIEKPPIEDDWDCPSLSIKWINANGEYCYLFEVNKRKWFQANYECMRKGGSLVSIHSTDEAFLIHSVRKYYQIPLARRFIGLHRGFTNKAAFEWIDGSDLSYQHWSVYEPNNEKEECVEMFAYNMRWNDRPCDDAQEFICSARKVRPKVPEEEVAVPSPSTTPSAELTTNTCICPTDQPTTIFTEVITNDCSCPTCPSISPDKTEEIKHEYSILPANIKEIIESAFQISSCPIQPNITDAIESALKDYIDLRSTTVTREDLIQDEKESSAAENVTVARDETLSPRKNEIFEKTSSYSDVITSTPDLSKVFIETSMITPEGFEKENLYSALLKKNDWQFQDSSALINAIVEPSKLRKTAEERALIMRQKTDEHELIMKLIKEEHESRMKVLNAQLKLLGQISEMIAQNPESVHLIM